MPGRKSKIVILYALLCLIWGTTWFAIKVSLASTPPFFGAGLRFLISAVILWGIVWWKKDYPPLNRQALKVYLSFGIGNITIGYALSYWGTQYIYSNLSSIIWAGLPLLVTFIAHFLLPNERFTLRKSLSILAGTLGVVLIISASGAIGGSNVKAGILVIALAVVTAAWASVYLKKNHAAIRTVPLNAVAQTLGGVIIMIISGITERHQTMVWNGTNISALLYLAIFGSVITWLIYVWLFAHLPVTTISYTAFIPPVIATIVGWLLLDEKLTPLMLVGATLVLAGVIILNPRRRKPV